MAANRDPQCLFLLYYHLATHPSPPTTDPKYPAIPKMYTRWVGAFLVHLGLVVVMVEHIAPLPLGVKVARLKGRVYRSRDESYKMGKDRSIDSCGQMSFLGACTFLSCLPSSTGLKQRDRCTALTFKSRSAMVRELVLSETVDRRLYRAGWSDVISDLGLTVNASDRHMSTCRLARNLVWMRGCVPPLLYPASGWHPLRRVLNQCDGPSRDGPTH
ncbi:hypothetical protein R3P38DRAFT_3186750 [Favolaschia claudopus]|uniref:Uncharacterized protein n=1 Tax=Favolaschia claudopus TaxID=2862362 RepID=A0AAW0C1Z8_9AGAR